MVCVRPHQLERGLLKLVNSQRFFRFCKPDFRVAEGTWQLAFDTGVPGQQGGMGSCGRTLASCP